MELVDYSIKRLDVGKDKEGVMGGRGRYGFSELFMFEVGMEWLNGLEKA
ncbi:hypothetical protein [Staphylococcus hominis]|nr:hypothetical protein [Staphylococcus hominis]